MTDKQQRIVTDIILPPVCCVAFVVTFSWPILRKLGHVGVVWDWPEFATRYWAMWYTVHRYHQVPLWNPYVCGGEPLLAHPSTSLFGFWGQLAIFVPLVAVWFTVIFGEWRKDDAKTE